MDTTDVAKWEENVRKKAIKIIESYLKNSKCDYESIKPRIDEEKKHIDGNSSNFCEICQRIIIGDKTFKIHLQSNKHKKMLNKLKKNNTVTEVT